MPKKLLTAKRMAHNLHLFVVKADSAEDACNTVEAEVEGWGTENNWRTICGAVSDTGLIYIVEDWSPETWSISFQGINNYVQEHLSNFEDKEQILALLQRHIKNSLPNSVKFILDETNPKEEPLTSQDWFLIKLYVEHMEELVKFKKPFNIEEDSFHSGEYDNFGVTQLGYDEGEHLYVVFMDMHS